MDCGYFSRLPDAALTISYFTIIGYVTNAKMSFSMKKRIMALRNSFTFRRFCFTNHNLQPSINNTPRS